jgi:flavin-dependent dehydrogenase
MKMVVLGSSLEGLLLCYELAKQHHDVMLIDLEAEIGMPVQHPGRVVDREILTNYFSEEEQNFLALYSNTDGWGCRWEWVLKFLSHRVAREGVQCYTRTRVLKIEKHENEVKITLSSHERQQPETIHVDTVINMLADTKSGPGARQHVLGPMTPTVFPLPPQSRWFGETRLVRVEDRETNDAIFQLRRGDALVEYWWNHRPSGADIGDAIERCEVVLPLDPDEVSFDAAVRRVQRFIENLL